MTRKSVFQILFLVTGFILLNSCGGGGSSISVLPTTAAFDETQSINPKVDVLWVIDPSRSMKQNVKNVSDNIQVFLSDFVTKDYDFRMGVISTAAWSSAVNDVSVSGSLDFFGSLHGGGCIGQSENQVLTSGATETVSAFITRFQRNFDVYGAALNTSSCGLDFFTDYAAVTGNYFATGLDSTARSTISGYVNDERPLQSLKTYLENDPQNFLREDAFLAVIIVTDELDASRDDMSPSLSFDPAGAGNHSAQSYVDFLAGLPGKDLSKVAIYAITDESLETSIVKNIARTAALNSGGLAFDIGADSATYAENLGRIKGEILTQASIYALTKEALVQTITVELITSSGLVSVPKAEDSSGSGWVFIPGYGDHGGIQLVGAYTPTPGNEIILNFTPANLSSGQISEPYINISSKTVPEHSPEDTVVGTVALFNKTLQPADTAVYAIDPSNAKFKIDASTGVLSVATISPTADPEDQLDSETAVKETVVVTLTITPETGNPLTLTRSFVISVSDIPDTAPQAGVASFEVSEGSFTGDTITIIGTLSDYVSGLDASEAHEFAFTGAPSHLTLVDAASGEFRYQISKTEFAALSGTYPLNISYTVTGTQNTPTEMSDDESDSSQLSIHITPANNAPVYATSVCPGGNYDYCEGETIRPNSEGTEFDLVTLAGSDVTASGIAQGTADALVGAGNAGFRTAANASGYHEVTITFPTNKMYEVGCVRVYRDNSSLGNGIYQILAPGNGNVVLTREVFPVDVTTRSNMGNTAPQGSQGACNILSNDYFTIYTDRKYIGGKLKLLRPSGSLNPAGHAELRLNKIEVYGIEAKYNNIDLNAHFTDEDITDGNSSTNLTYYVTDAYGEGPAPGWATISGASTLQLLPPSSVNIDLGVVAVDSQGAEAFATIHVEGSAGDSVGNAGPISLLALDDTKRGGLSMSRWGGTNTTASCTLPSGKNNLVHHIEIDNFIFKPYDVINTGYYDIAADSAQAPQMGDTRGGESEDGWCSEPVFSDPKYPNTTAPTYCVGHGNQGDPVTAHPGRIYPCVNTARSYGEIYSGFFVPATTGVYKFRTKVIDNTIMLRMAATEYHDDTQQIFIANWQDSALENSLLSLTNGVSLGSSAAQQSEFAGSGSGGSFTNYRAIPYNTQLFYSLNNISQSYKDGYMYLRQGNVHAFEMRFGEGGGSVAFNFEYNRKDASCDPTNASPAGSCWDGWKALDASTVVPNEGAEGHTPFYVSHISNAVDFDASSLFYDAEQDIIEYSARLVNADGSDFNDGSISQIGLEIGILSGRLTGSLNSTYTTAPNKPRIVFKAKERYYSGEVESLLIKFQ